MPTAKPYDAGDEEQVSKQKTTHRSKAETDDEYLRVVISTYEGRALVWRILALAGVFRSSFTGDVHTYYNEGKRGIGLEIIEILNTVDPQALVLMQDENIMRENNG
jgi:hypothetical protein